MCIWEIVGIVFFFGHNFNLNEGRTHILELFQTYILIRLDKNINKLY